MALAWINILLITFHMHAWWKHLDVINLILFSYDNFIGPLHGLSNHSIQRGGAS